MGSLPSHPTRRREFLDCGCINLEIRIRIQFVSLRMSQEGFLTDRENHRRGAPLWHRLLTLKGDYYCVMHGRKNGLAKLKNFNFAGLSVRSTSKGEEEEEEEEESHPDKRVLVIKLQFPLGVFFPMRMVVQPDFGEEAVSLPTHIERIHLVS